MIPSEEGDPTTPSPPLSARVPAGHSARIESLLLWLTVFVSACTVAFEAAEQTALTTYGLVPGYSLRRLVCQPTGTSPSSVLDHCPEASTGPVAWIVAFQSPWPPHTMPPPIARSPVLHGTVSTTGCCCGPATV